MGGSQQRMSGPMRYAGWVVAVSVCVILAFSDAGAPRKEASQEPITQDDHDMEVYNEWKAENAGAPDGPLSDSITQNQGDVYSAWLASEGPVERRATDAYIRSFRRSGSGSGSGSGSPTKAPTAPTKAPTNAPTFAPSKAPTFAPSNAPSFAPSGTPSNAPSFAPTVEPVQAVQEVDVVMPYESANDFVKDVKRVTVVKKGYGKSIRVMKDACTTCLPPPTARPTTCTTTCVLKAGRRSGLYEPYWVLKDGVGIDMKVKQSNRRACITCNYVHNNDRWRDQRGHRCSHGRCHGPSRSGCKYQCRNRSRESVCNCNQLYSVCNCYCNACFSCCSNQTTGTTAFSRKLHGSSSRQR